VLCRVYQKSGPGPRNGEQYGAPVEEDDDDRDGLEREELNHLPIEYEDGFSTEVLENPHGNEIMPQGESIMEVKPLVKSANPEGKVRRKVHVVC
jgi:hypothetical protein